MVIAAAVGAAVVGVVHCWRFDSFQFAAIYDRPLVTKKAKSQYD